MFIVSKFNCSLLQVDLERNEHIAWIPSNPMQSIILKKTKIAPTEINFEFQGFDLSINRNNGNLNWANAKYICSKISMEDSQTLEIKIGGDKERKAF